MFQGMPYSPRAFVQIVLEQNKPRSIGCWNGVMNLNGTSEDELRNEMGWIFRQNERAAWNSVEFARNESDKHLARNAARYASYAAPAAREGEQWSSSDWQDGPDGAPGVAVAAVDDSLPGGGVKDASLTDLHVQ